MRTINTLTPEIISHIAAGEVVERPASALKELIENSLDAGATHISIILEDAGIKSMQIKDNGKGMSTEDIALCFLPHTTSKISDKNDLLSIKSFGFRGEALWSIAAVSNMTIKSRTAHSESGTKIEVKNSTQIAQEPCGMPVGTDIKIDSLFNSTPARKKFLKDPKVELRAITAIVEQFALAFPHVHFELINNKKSILSLHSEKNILERITKVLGNTITQYLLPIEHTSRYGKIIGFIGHPQIAQNSRSHQYIYINNRSITHHPIAHTVKDSFGSLIEPKTFPVFLLFLELPYENVDVNIHPRKEEVGFAYPKELLNLTHESIALSLSKHNLTYSEKSTEKDMNAHMAHFLKNTVNPWSLKDLHQEEIMQINNLYLIAPTKDGMLVVDQHAAHERILFEQFKTAFESKAKETHVLELPQSVLLELSISDTLLLEENIDVLKNIGFDISLFGPRIFKLSAVPEIFRAHDHRLLIQNVLEDIKTSNKIKK